VVTAAAPVTVTHALGRYPVYVEPGALGQLDALVTRHLPRRRLCLIADATVAALLADRLLAGLLRADATLTFPAGEASKTRATWAELTDALLEDESIPEIVIIYLNRLSDLLFTLARLANRLAGGVEEPW
jgi:3-dehydroquinate synthetase